MPAYRPLVERFVEKFELDPITTCWNWTACLGTKGYGKFQVSARKCMDAHKVAFEIFRGFVPYGTELHHICNNRRCVNPNHLQPMPHETNCDWNARRNGHSVPHTYVIKPYERHWTEEQIKSYWAWREFRIKQRNKKLTGRKPKPLLDRLIAQIKLSDTGCWEWQGFREKGGYGRIKDERRVPQMAHRISYILFIGDIPDGLTVDHMCRNACCVNPNHLRLLTRSENSDGGWVKKFREATACKYGHPFNELNTYPRPLKNGKVGRGCKLCKLRGQAKLELMKKLGLTSMYNSPNQA